MYADAIYHYINAGNNAESREYLINLFTALEENIPIIHDYLYIGVSYANAINKDNCAIKVLLHEYEEVRQFHGQRNYYMEWDLRNRNMIQQYPTNTAQIDDYFNHKSTHSEISNNDNYVLNSKICNDTTLIHEFLDLVSFLESIDYTIVKCRRCGRNFIAPNRKSNALYCNLIYKDTNSTCQMITTNKKYKDSKKELPIYKTYITFYNRLKAKVRRGTLDKSQAPFDELLRLRDRYLNLYDSSDESEKENVFNAFKQEATCLIDSVTVKKKKH